ncbi:MAG TPA: DUF3300 domain-containing protein [Usitatibacter sp.]
MKILARAFIPLAAALVAAPPALAQATYEQALAPTPYAVAQAAYSDAELDQMLAPIALYPDELLSQILMAATYPLEVVEAARWSRAHPDLQGEDAVGAVDSQDWDPSVKSLVAFPQVLQQMDADLDWTQRLGEAFLAQQDGVMASVQRLRRAAMNAGTLSSTDEAVVTREGTDIAIDSPSPDTVYVPYYDPGVAYGNWWWPSYPPMAWSPWPGYYYSGGYGLAWTIGVPVGIDFFFGDFDWRRHHVRLHEHRPFYDHDHDRDRDRDRDHRGNRDNRWRHDPHHRRGVEYRNPVARQEFGGAIAPRPPRNARNGQRGRTQSPTGASPIARPDRARDRVTPPSPPARIVQPGANPLAPSAQPPLGRSGGSLAPQPRARPQVQQPLARPQVQQPLAHPQVQQPLARPQVQQPLARPQVQQPRARDMGPVHAAPQPQVRVAPPPPPQPAPSAPARIAPIAPHPAPAQPAARPSTPPPPPARGSDQPQNPMAR